MIVSALARVSAVMLLPRLEGARRLALVLLLAPACGPDVAVGKRTFDSDSDGYASDVDCDDAHADVNPDAPELCDERDNDCDGTVDEDATDAPAWYVDGDGDTFGGEEVHACDAPAGTVAEAGDCDDALASIHPGADEVCDGVDQDCDQEIDEDAVDATAWYTDGDDDGWGAGEAAYACEGGEGLTAADGDCDDTRDDIHPDAAEDDCTDPTDYNCDGSVGYADDDADGWAACEECDDHDSDVHPGAAEVCDGVDQDCDADVDEGVTSTFYADGDGDSYGDAGGTVEDCAPPSGYVTDATDCDDAEASVNPGAVEMCDGADEDCDGSVDEGAGDAPTWYGDGDRDGYGDAATSTVACAAPAGYLADATDCDDGAATVHPGATETCDGIDEDCDGTADDGASGSTVFYADADGDGYGDPAAATTACVAPAGYVPNGNDCDDGNGAVNPGATEVCDAADVDEDCDGAVDDADGSVTGRGTWYRDADADSYGGTTTTLTCDRPSGYVTTSTDCDDGNASVNPGATEVCDAADVDEDCDGAADDADASVTGRGTWHRDADADTYGGTATTVTCDRPSGYVTTSTDCNDGDAAVHPGATEVCDAADVDEDCDGAADDADASVTGRGTWYRDADADSYGGTTTAVTCDRPSGYVTTSTDCDDGNGAVNPGATEVCDAADVDEDCDGAVDDADGSVTGRGTWYRDADADADSYGGTTTAVTCDRPSGYVATSTDCDDAESSAHPGGVEVCDDGIDQDCSGADEVCPPAGYAGAYDPDDAYATKILGVSASSDFGYGLAAGDFDGDGASDLLVGDVYYNGGTTYSGGVFGYYGPLTGGAQLATTNDDLLLYNNASAWDQTFGGRITNVLDVNEDGKDDALVLGEGATSLLYYGGDSGTLLASTPVDRTVTCTGGAAAPEWDPSSSAPEWLCADYLASTNRGAVTAYSGPSTTLVSYTGEASYDYAGTALASGDLDGDGLEDLAVGAYMADVGLTDNGAVYVVYDGATSGTVSLATADAKIRGDAASDNLGRTLAIPGDLDGDGDDDLVIGVPNDDTAANNAGKLCLVSTPATGVVSAQTAATILGVTAGDFIGLQAMDVGDFDGDGALDLLVGAYQHDAGVGNIGGVWLYYAAWTGTLSLTDADASWTGSTANEQVGYRVAALPDADGDGDDEIVFSGIGSDDAISGTAVGAVWVWPGE